MMSGAAAQPGTIFRLAFILLTALGIFFVAAGAAWATFMLAGVRYNPYVPAWVPLFFFSMGLGLTIIPGAVYLCVAPLVRKGRNGPMIAAVSLSVVHAASVATVSIALAMRGHVKLPVCCALCSLALVVLALTLVRAYYSLRTRLQQGFQPIIAPAPVIPIQHGRSAPD